MTYAGYSTNTRMRDDEDAVTLEDVFKKYASFAGIHDFEFINTLDTFDPAHWSALASGGAYNGKQITQTGTVGVDQFAWYDQNMPHSFTFEVTAFKNKFTAAVRGNGTDTYYKVFYSALGKVGVSKIVSGAVDSTSQRIILAEEAQGQGGARFKVSVRDSQFTSDSPGRIIYISLWLNDRCIFSYSDNVETGNPPLQFALIIPASLGNGVVYSDFKVPNLGEIITWSSLDPGEHPIDAIQRAIEDRYIKYWTRWNGHLKAWNPGPRETSVTIPTSREFSHSVNIDTRQIFSHLRVVGAFQWVQLTDPDIVRMVGHRFREINNTSLWNADDCVKIGQQMFVRSKEQMFQAQLSGVGLIFLENEDRIKLPDIASAGSYTDYIVDSISWDFASGTFKNRIQARRYYYGEP